MIAACGKSSQALRKAAPVPANGEGVQPALSGDSCVGERGLHQSGGARDQSAVVRNYRGAGGGAGNGRDNVVHLSGRKDRAPTSSDAGEEKGGPVSGGEERYGPEIPCPRKTKEGVTLSRIATPARNSIYVAFEALCALATDYGPST